MAVGVTVMSAWRRGSLEIMEFGWLRAVYFKGGEGEGSFKG